MRIIGNDPSVPRQTQEVASGTLPNGKPVIVNADGTVSVAAATGATQALGSATVFASANTTHIVACFDSNSNKVVIAYADNGNSTYGTAIVGTVSGTSISFGTEVVFSSSDTRKMEGIAFDSSNNKVVIPYANVGSSQDGTAIVGTVSGTSISFGTAVVFHSGAVDWVSATFDSSNNKVVVFYTDVSAGQDTGHAIVGTVSGTSISFGSEATFNSGATFYVRSTFDSNSNKIVIAYRDNGNNDYGTAIVGTVSGTSISFGSEAVFESAVTNYTSAIYDSNAQKVVIVYQDDANSDYGMAVVGTVSGTSISFGTAVAFESAASSYSVAIYDATAKKVVIAYQDGGNSDYGTIISGTVSGTSISFDTAAVFESATTAYIGLAYDSNAEKVAIAYRDYGNSSYGTSIVFQTAYTSTNITSENYIGMSSGPASSSSLGSATAFDSGSNPFVQTAYDTTSNKVVISYKDNSNSSYGTAVVGTVSGTSISFGTPVVFASEAMSTSNPVVFDSSNNKIVISFKANDASGKAIVGTVSGTSISFGSASQFESATVTPPITSCFDSSSNKVFIAYGKSTNGYGIVATVSGTSISFGSAVAFDSSIGGTPYISSAFDSTNSKVVVAYRDGNNSNYGTAAIGTISGTSVSFGTPVVFAAVAVGTTKTAFDSANGKIVHSYYASGVAAKARVGTVSGTSISYGTEASVTSTVGAVNNIAFDSSRNQIVVLISISANPYNLKAFAGSVSGTDIAFGSASDITAADVYDANVVHDPDSKINIIAYNTGSNGTAQTFNAELRGEVANGGHALVDTQGAIADNLSGLTAGQSYFVQNDGTLGTTAADPSVFAGTAVSATKLIVKG